MNISTISQGMSFGRFRMGRSSPKLLRRRSSSMQCAGSPEIVSASIIASGTAAAELGLSGELSSALTKLSATVPAPALETAEALASVVVVDRRRWFASAEEVPLLPVLRDAATRRRRLRLRYASAGKTPSDGAGVRTVDPYGLVENAGRWYLLAAHRGRQRTYRVSRILSATTLDEPARVPDDLDLAAAWARQRAAFEQRAAPCRITVAVHPDAVEFFATYSRFQLAAGSTIVRIGDDDGWPVLELSFRARRAAVAIVARRSPTRSRRRSFRRT